MKLKSIYIVVYKQSARQNILLFLIFHISFYIIICNKVPRQENSNFIFVKLAQCLFTGITEQLLTLFNILS